MAHRAPCMPCRPLNWSRNAPRSHHDGDDGDGDGEGARRDHCFQTTAMKAARGLAAERWPVVCQWEHWRQNACAGGDASFSSQDPQDPARAQPSLLLAWAQDLQKRQADEQAEVAANRVVLGVP